jgi:protein-S-isoprenylcysteine O-methyltransferase Ste14
MADKKERAKIKIEPSIIVLVFVVLALLLGRLIGIALPAPQIVRWLGLALSALGLALGLLALREFKRMRASSNPKNAATGLVTSGIYGFSRHPIYLGFLLILIGFPLSDGNYWGVLLTPMFIVVMNSMVIKPEETNLEKKFKVQYTDYQSRVRRWL